MNTYVLASDANKSKMHCLLQRYSQGCSKCKNREALEAYAPIPILGSSMSQTRTTASIVIVIRTARERAHSGSPPPRPPEMLVAPEETLGEASPPGAPVPPCKLGCQSGSIQVQGLRESASTEVRGEREMEEEAGQRKRQGKMGQRQKGRKQASLDPG